MRTRRRNAETRVGQGMRFLDAIVPGWIDVIDIAKLDAADPCHCPIAQACKSKFSTGMKRLKLSIREGRALGFVAVYNPYYTDYETLTAAWRAAIMKRREENARGKMEQIAKVIIRGTPTEKPVRECVRHALATRS